MSKLGETPGNKTVRLTREKRIFDYNAAGDARQSNYELDRWPYGEVRSLAIKGIAGQVTEPIPIVTPEMLEQHRRDML